jgi:hypothetical protein
VVIVELPLFEDKMKLSLALAPLISARVVSATFKLACSQLVIERLEP